MFKCKLCTTNGSLLISKAQEARRERTLTLERNWRKVNFWLEDIKGGGVVGGGGEVESLIHTLCRFVLKLYLKF